MILRLIARDLYCLRQEVDRLEKELIDCPPAGHDALKRKLAQAKADRNQISQMLDGHLDR